MWKFNFLQENLLVHCRRIYHQFTMCTAAKKRHPITEKMGTVQDRNQRSCKHLNRDAPLIVMVHEGTGAALSHQATSCLSTVEVGGHTTARAIRIIQEQRGTQPDRIRRTRMIVYLPLVLVVLGLARSYGRSRIVVVVVLRGVFGLDDDAVELDDAVAVVRPPGLRRPRVAEVLLAEPDPAEVVGAVAARPQRHQHAGLRLRRPLPVAFRVSRTRGGLLLVVVFQRRAALVAVPVFSSSLPPQLLVLVEAVSPKVTVGGFVRLRRRDLGGRGRGRRCRRDVLVLQLVCLGGAPPMPPPTTTRRARMAVARRLHF
jgi:hypothetical protein